MKDKYIKFFKKELVFLLILLVIVCFSFGLTYSNFVYSSDEFRAVEMFASRLEYELSNTKLTVKPGNNYYKINIKSLNNIRTYYKIIYDNNNLNIKYFNRDGNIIESNGNKIINLVIFNKTNKNEIVNIDIMGGFTTNKYEDINIKDNYYEVKDNLEVGEIVTLNNQIYRLLEINDNGSYKLISDLLNDEIIANASNGYNQYINLINTDIEIEGLVDSKAVSLEDIEKYTKNKIIDYGALHYLSDVYFPELWSYENGSIVDNSRDNNVYSNSEGVIEGTYKQASSIMVKDFNINNVSFINEKYEEIFTNSNYLIATRYSKSKENTAVWGVLSMENGNIKLNELFESNLLEHIVTGKHRKIVNISSSIDLFNKAL